VTQPAEPTADAPRTLSLERLRSAFARMLGPEDAPDERPAPDADAATPEGIVEALLFAGRGDDRPLPAEAIAEVIRDVSPAEVEQILQRLDEGYRRDGAACRVERTAGGYRLTLADGLERVADRLRGRVRATRLSPQALETLAVVAYRQPITAAAVDELRGSPSQATLAQLKRLGLIREDAPSEAGDGPHFLTTDRLLRTLGLASVDQLPRLAELDD